MVEKQARFFTVSSRVFIIRRKAEVGRVGSTAEPSDDSEDPDAIKASMVLPFRSAQKSKGNERTTKHCHCGFISHTLRRDEVFALGRLNSLAPARACR